MSEAKQPTKPRRGGKRELAEAFARAHEACLVAGGKLLPEMQSIMDKMAAGGLRALRRYGQRCYDLTAMRTALNRVVLLCQDEMARLGYQPPVRLLGRRQGKEPESAQKGRKR